MRAPVRVDDRRARAAGWPAADAESAGRVRHHRDTFEREYLPDEPLIALICHEMTSSSEGKLTQVTAQLMVDGRHVTVTGTGNGPIDAFVTALNDSLGTDIDVVDYAEHAIGAGKDASAVAYVESRTGEGQVRWGIGVDPNILTASFHAVVSTVLRQRPFSRVSGR